MALSGRAYLLIAAAISALTWVILNHGEQSDEPIRDSRIVPTQFEPNLQQVISYEFDYKMRGDFNIQVYSQLHADTQQEAMYEAMKGNIHFKFEQFIEDKWQVLGIITVHDISEQNLFSVAIDEALYFQFDLSTAGVMSDIRGESDAAREMAKMLLQHMQTVLPSEQKPTWTSKEKDTIGTYYANYQNDPADALIYKTKTHYIEYNTTQSSFSWSNTMPRTRISNYQQTIRLRADNAWIEQLSLNEQLSAYIDDRVSDTVQNQLSINQVDTQDRLTFKVVGSDNQNQDSLTREIETIEAYYKTEPELDALAAGLNHTDAFLNYLQLYEQEDKETLALAFIINYLRLQPEAVFALVDELDNNPDISHSASLRLWYAIAAAGHREAQAALVQVIMGDQFSDNAKNRALSVIHDVEFPTDILVDGVLSARTDLQAGAREQGLRNMATLALGSLANPNKLNKEQTSRAQDMLVQALDSAQSSEQQALVLSAMGNAADPSMVDIIAESANQGDKDVRATAMITLMKIPHMQATTRFYELMENEQDADVKYVALERLARRDKDDMKDWAIAKVSSEQDPKHKVQLIHYLGRLSAESPDAEQTLRQLVTDGELTLEQKSAAYHYIKP